jgi:hypothetical protein
VPPGPGDGSGTAGIGALDGYGHSRRTPTKVRGSSSPGSRRRHDRRAGGHYGIIQLAARGQASLLKYLLKIDLSCLGGQSSCPGRIGDKPSDMKVCACSTTRGRTDA